MSGVEQGRGLSGQGGDAADPIQGAASSGSIGRPLASGAPPGRSRRSPCGIPSPSRTHTAMGPRPWIPAWGRSAVGGG